MNGDVVVVRNALGDELELSWPDVTRVLQQLHDEYEQAAIVEMQGDAPPVRAPAGDVTRDRAVFEREQPVVTDIGTWLVVHALLQLALRHPTVPQMHSHRIGYEFSAALAQALVNAGALHPRFAQDELDKLPAPAGCKRPLIVAIADADGACPSCGIVGCAPHVDGLTRRCPRTGEALA